jgi:hypothetical protein
MNKCNCREEKQITIDRDYNIPDVKPDAFSIIKEQGNVQIEEVRMTEGRAGVRGEVLFQILYAADAQMPVCEMTGSIPFEEMIPLSCAERDDELTVNAVIEDLRSELINSRKIGLKAIVSLEAVAETVCDGEGAVDIDEAEHVYTKKKSMEISHLVFTRKDTLRVRDEWKIPGTKDAIGKILYSDFRLEEMDTRLLENELQVNGEANLFVIYLSNAENPSLNYFETTMPVEGKLDCNGCDAGMVAQVTTGIHSRDLEIKEDEDGESRILDAELVLDFAMKIFGQEELSLLTDFYSTKEICQPVYEDGYFENLVVQNKSKARISGKISLPNQVPLQIWNVTGELRIDRKEQKADSILIEGVADVSILYQTGEDKNPLVSAKGSIPFEHRIEAEGIQPDSNVWLRGTLEQVTGGLSGNGEVDIKAVAGLEVVAFNRIDEPVISGFECREIDKKERSREPGMVGYVVQQEEELWDIAKRFYTTVENILQVNQLETADIKEGDVLLLLKEA